MNGELTYKIRGWWGKINTRLSDQTFMEQNGEAIKLLPVLVERGYAVNLSGSEATYECACAWLQGDKVYEVAPLGQPTISAAICTAVLSLIDREGKP